MAEDYFDCILFLNDIYGQTDLIECYHFKHPYITSCNKNERFRKGFGYIYVEQIFLPLVTSTNLSMGAKLESRLSISDWPYHYGLEH